MYFFSRFSHSSSSGAADCKVGKWLFSVQMCSSSCWQMSHGLAARPVFLVEMAMQHLVRFPHDLYSSWHTSGFWIAAGRAAGMKTRMCLIASNVYRFPPSFNHPYWLSPCWAVGLISQPSGGWQHAKLPF